jgi:hypothetical protein
MKKILFLVLIFNFSYSKDLIKFYINQNHTTLVFAESLANAQYVSKIPKQIYMKRYKENIKKFVKLHKEVSRSRIYGHKKTKNLLEALYLQSIKFDNFQDFKKNMLSYRTTLGSVKIKLYFIYFKKLLDRYDKIIYNKKYKKLLYLKKQLKKIMKDKNFNDLVKKIAHFYKVNLNNLDTINIALYPISHGRNINAYSIKNLETIGLFTTGAYSLNWLLSATILHEISHTIYAKSKFVKRNLLNIKNKTKRRVVNEILATAMGAGWGYNQLTQKHKLTPWYNNTTYNKYARIIYPKLNEYMRKNKTIDKKFVKYIKGLIR